MLCGETLVARIALQMLRETLPAGVSGIRGCGGGDTSHQIKSTWPRR